MVDVSTKSNTSDANVRCEYDQNPKKIFETTISTKLIVEILFTQNLPQEYAMARLQAMGTDKFTRNSFLIPSLIFFAGYWFDIPSTNVVAQWSKQIIVANIKSNKLTTYFHKMVLPFYELFIFMTILNSFSYNTLLLPTSKHGLPSLSIMMNQAL